MSDTVLTAFVNTIPAILWVLFATLVFLALRSVLIPQLSRLSSIKAPGVELSFAEQLLDAAATGPGGAQGTAPPASNRRAAVSRLEHALEIVRDGRILWVDDHPEWNVPLTSLFTRVGMIVDTAISTADAMRMLDTRSYDIVITDMRRDNETPAATAGLTLMDAMMTRGVRLPVLVFAAGFDPRQGVHPAIFAYTNRADDAVQYVIDLMERVKFGAAL